MEHIRNGDLKLSYEQELFSRRRRTYADGELDVFSAERYFNGAMDDDGKHKEGPPAPAESVARARPAVPVSKSAWTCASAASAGSGASSTNSQTVLLRDARRRRGSKWCLQVSELLLPCSGKRAVRIDDGGAAAKVAAESSKTAASRIDVEWYRDLRMMEKANLELAGGEGNRGLQPNLTVGAAKVAAVGRQEKAAAEYMSASFRRGSFTLQAPVKVSGDDKDDSGSESSSDLFEIKSLMIDDDCPYEPSEASIQWSVVTASAVDMTAPSRGSGRGIRGPVTERQNRERPVGVGLLTGCVSRRAVSLSEITAVRRFPDSPVRRRMGG